MSEAIALRAPDPDAGPLGALLVNLGTPVSPGTADVRRYLDEFLSDPRVLDMNAALRWLLLHGVILRTRPRRSAAAYRQVWMAAGSPLLVHSRALRDAVADELGSGWVVELAMRYGEPAIGPALERLRAVGISRLVVLPLFPQYSEAATGSALAQVDLEARQLGFQVPRIDIPSFATDPEFVGTLADLTRESLAGFDADFVLFSYHGLPERQIRSSDPTGETCLERDDCCRSPGRALASCYRAQCYATTRHLVEQLGLDTGGYETSFQSRLGRTPWIQPFTDHVIPELAARGIKRLVVICPSFTADCLETLEEIGIRGAAQWSELGGEALELVSCVNAEPRWARGVASLLGAAL
jgi:ferrochelatase